MSSGDLESRASGEPGRFYSTVRRCFALSLRVFFRRIQVEGLGNIPARGGGILIAWHPNAVIDGMLLAAECPRPITFGARHGLFDVPLLGRILRGAGAVPIYRACDTPEQKQEERRAANVQSLAKLAEAVASGRLTALFPEGLSHDAPHPAGLKTGAARLYDMARGLRNDPEPFVLPVGLHYGAKDRGRSTVLVRFLAPLDLPEELTRGPAGEDGPARHARLRELTAVFERAIHEDALATENWERHALMHRTRKLLRAELAYRRKTDPGPASPSEKRAGVARVWTAYQTLVKRNPAGTDTLLKRLTDYDRGLRELRLEDHDLDPIHASSGTVHGLAIARAVVLLALLAPLTLFGYATNGPTAALLLGLAHAFGRLAKDRATIKVLGGMLLLPFTWAAAGLITAYAVTSLPVSTPGPGALVGIGILGTVTGILGIPATFAFHRTLNETIRGVRTRATRHRRRAAVSRLREARAALFDDLVEETNDLELPGSVLRDGRVEPEP